MARKLNKNLAAISTAAIVAIYGVGYVRTQPAADHAAAALSAQASAVALVTPPPAASVAPASPAPSATVIARAIATAMATAPAATVPAARTPSVATQPPAPTAVAAAYRDGTYNGSGTSRRGGIDVALTIQGGKVAGVQITHSTTYYPTSRIARLPGEVVDHQSAQVDMVSGATDSSRAFRAAVADALTQATNARTGAVVPAAG